MHSGGDTVVWGWWQATASGPSLAAVAQSGQCLVHTLPVTFAIQQTAAFRADEDYVFKQN